MQVSGGLRSFAHAWIFDKYYDSATRSLRDSEATPRKPARSVTCRGRDYSFRLRWERNTPIVSSFGSTEDEAANSILSGTIDEFLRAPCGVFAGGLYMSRIMSFPSFSIRRVTRTQGRRGDNLLIEFEFDPFDNKEYFESRPDLRIKAGQRNTTKAARKSRLWIEASPNEGWAIQGRGRDRLRGSKDPAHQVIAYGEARGGVPLPRRVSNYYPGVGRTRVFEIEKIEFGPIPESAFTLSAYGLPELGASPRARQDIRLAVVLFVGAFVALSIALVLRYAASRVRKE